MLGIAKINITTDFSINRYLVWDDRIWNFTKWDDRTAGLSAAIHITSGVFHGKWLKWDKTSWDSFKWFDYELGLRLKSSWVFNGAIYKEYGLKLSHRQQTFWSVFGNITHDVAERYTIDRYLALPTWQHRKPKFLEVLRFLIQPLVDIQNAAHFISERHYNVGTASGEELDTIGEWVGVNREIYPPINQVYFSWDEDRPGVKWGEGRWKRNDDPNNGMDNLPDDIYRFLVKAKIVANRWDGSVEGAYRVWNDTFGEDVAIMIQDHQNMSIQIILATSHDLAKDKIMQHIVNAEKIPLRPSGVNTVFTLVPKNDVKFVWDKESGPTEGGWGLGSWNII